MMGRNLETSLRQKIPEKCVCSYPAHQLRCQKKEIGSHLVKSSRNEMITMSKRDDFKRLLHYQEDG